MQLYELGGQLPSFPPGYAPACVAVAWVAVVVGGSCPGWQLSGWQLFRLL